MNKTATNDDRARPVPARRGASAEILTSFFLPPAACEKRDGIRAVEPSESWPPQGEISSPAGLNPARGLFIQRPVPVGRGASAESLITWPRTITEWQEGRTGYLSIPFTWLLPEAKQRILQRDMFVDRWVVGGPGVKLLPGCLADIADTGDEYPGVLQRVNPQATRTTAGCPNRCRFCGVRQISGEFRELTEWPDLPILCDDNLLGASPAHFDCAIDRLLAWPVCDFNQGLDARLLTAHHAARFAELRKPILRLALDHDRDRQSWADAVDRLRKAGVAKSRIRTYVLCGFDGGPDEDRARCEFVEAVGIKALPMWFHRLDAMRQNEVTDAQRAMGWTHRKRRELMCWYYWHRTLETRG